MTKTRDLANLIADSKVGPSEIDTTGTYNMNALQVGGTTVINSSRAVTADGLTVDGTATLQNILNIGGSDPQIRTDTSDGSDNKTLWMGGGGIAYSWDRGGFFYAQGNEAGGHVGITAGNVSGGSVKFTTGGSEAMRIGSAGNVGLGTTSTAGHSNHTNLFLGGTGNIYAEKAATADASLHISQNAHVDTDGSWEYRVTDEATNYYQYAGTHVWRYAASGTAGNDISWSEAMRLSSGNLLVGKTSADFGSSVGFEANSNDTVYATRSGGASLTLNRTTSDGDIALFRKDGTTAGIIGTHASNITIGTGATGLRFYDTDNVIMPRNPSTGANVNGTISLGEPLNRFKDIHLSGTIEVENGTGNVGVGKQALNSNSANENTAVGYQAGYSQTSGGYYNTYMGYASGYSNTGGDFNTYYGYQSGYSNQGGTGNTYIGKQAGYLMSGGNYNTILGGYNGNQGGLDIRTLSNQIVLSDGAGNPKAHITANGQLDLTHPSTQYTKCIQAISSYSGSTDGIIQAQATGSNFARHAPSAAIYRAIATRVQSSDFSFFAGSSNNANDTEIYLRGDGYVFADGTYSSAGADYAEYFEWSDGNSNEEDRRGYTVVLDGNMIRKATSDDDASLIIGVVSAHASVVGDADMDSYKHKYLRDDFGSYQRDAEGERILNPNYDENIEYTSREFRREWETIGMMGKLRIRKGQPTGSNWIKMRDVSNTVEEWLVR